VARYRLRFLLQEFDLSSGVTLLGRSSECHITIEDPLVSRVHARIDLANGIALVSDQGSRNGVRINGRVIHDATPLENGDRIRIGTQELVFARVETQPTSAKTTGFLRHCARCRLPYPEEAGTCPSCGSEEVLAEDTLTGRQGDQKVWQLQLYVEVLERALTTGRHAECERILARAGSEVDERVAQGGAVEGTLVAALSQVTSRVSVAAKSAMWACWAIRLHRQLLTVPSEETLRAFEQLAVEFPMEAGGTLGELAAFFAARPDLLGAAEAAARLSALADRAGSGGAGPARATAAPPFARREAGEA
jgi:hypothetical protein